ncbi:MAG TPA: hypothetical protein VFV28_09555, partial [Limnobacter sp.]|nr:hypothetical protein [Limnobacter sp.]
GNTTLLILLLSADLLFMGLHVVNTITPGWQYPLLNIEKEGGYPELFQYLKYFWTSLLFILLARRQRQFSYLAWAALFTYLLLDDALTIHERLGGQIAASLDLQPAFGVRPQDLGELLCNLSAGALLVLPLAWSYMKGSAEFRSTSKLVGMLVALLACFGVLVDFAHMMVHTGWKLKFAIAMLEDGGEMLAASLLVALVYSLGLHPPKTIRNSGSAVLAA